MRLYDYAASGNCYKVRLGLALLGYECERVPVDIFAGDTLTPDFGRLNPARETPVLELDDGRVILQSNAILWYLADGCDLIPRDRFGRAAATQWLAFEQEWVMSGIGGARFRVLTGRQPAAVEARLEQGRRALDSLMSGLTSPFVVGDRPSIADISLYAYTHVAPDAGIDLDRWPTVQEWLARIEALPGFMNDLAPYPPNAQAGRGRSIYDGG